MIHKPKVLILDEPTTGVDAVSRKEFWEMLQRLRNQGITILVSTPYMDEASLCDRIALIQQGEIFKVETPERMEAGFPEDLWAVTSPVIYKTAALLEEMPGRISVNSFGQALHLVTPKGVVKEEEITEFLAVKGETNFTVKPIRATIEDVFMHFMLNAPKQ
jgi:ABC-type multidrug transport system ATPase subunit